MRLLSLFLALGLGASGPGKARGRARPDGVTPPSREPPPVKQGRRHAGRAALGRLRPQRSPGGHHTVEVADGAVLLDGRRLPTQLGRVEVLAPPTWRGDGRAVAWIERGAGETRLMVLADVADLGTAPPLAWPLPRNLARERLHWAAANRVVVGPELLSPRAVASWE